MEELNETKTPEVLESRAAVEEFEIAEVSLKNAAAQKQNNKKPIDWLKVGIAGTLACSVLSLGLSCAALIKKSNNNQNDNNQSSNVNYGESFTVSTDGYLVIDGVKTDVKIGSTSDIIDAEIKNVDKWGISTYIKFTFDDGSYMTTTPKEQVMNDHYYDAASADDLQALVAYGAPKVRLTSHVNLTSALELDSNLEVDLNNKTIMYTATAPIDVKEGVALRLANGNVTFNTPKAMLLNKAAVLEINDATIQAQGTIAEVAGDNAKVEIFDSSISTTGKVVDVAETINNFALNVNDTELETADAGNVYVSTEEALREAILDANVTSITLSTNVDVETGIYVKRNVTVNLNGKTLSSTQNTKVNGIFTVFAGATLTIEGNGSINSACQTNDYSMAIWAYGGEVVINGGTYTNIGAKDHDGTNPNNNELIYVSNSGKVTINGGTFIGNSENDTHGAKYTLNADDGSVNPFVVKGGSFVAYNPSASASESPIANFVSLGYKVVENNGVYTVVEEAGHIYAANATELVNAVANEDVTSITLSSNIDVETGVYVKRNVTVNLNGKTLTSTKNPKVNGIFTVFAGAKLTIEGNGTINAACQTNDYSMAIWAYGGEVVINGGTYTNVGAKDHDGTKPNNNDLIYVSHNGKITINAGTFIGNSENDIYGAKFTLNSLDEKTNTTDRESGDIIVKGGTFYGYNPSTSDTENPITNFVALGYKVVENNGVYTVVEEAGHIYAANYAELVSAVANTEVETITISTNINLDTAVYVKRNVTVNLNGKTLTATQDPNGFGLFCVFTGAKLTINGEGTVNSACQTNDFSIAVWAYGGEVVINGGTYTNVGAKDHDSNGANNNELIYVNNGGKITINGGTFIGNTENDTHGAKYTLNSQDEKTSTPARESGDIIVKGGTFYGFDPSASSSESPTANFVAEGFTVVEDNGVFTVVAE